MHYLCAFLLVVKPLALTYSAFSRLFAYSTLCLICLKSFCFLLIRYFTKSSKKLPCLCFFLFFLHACVCALSLLLSVSLLLFWSVLLEHYILSCQISSSQLKFQGWIERDQPEALENDSFLQRNWILWVLNEEKCIIKNTVLGLWKGIS